MKNLKIIFLIALLTFFFSCSKDEPNEDLASEIAGTYTGTVTANGSASVAATSALIKHTNTVVNLIITIGSTPINLDGIDVTRSPNNIYALSLVDASGSFTGTVNGNKLDWTLTAGSIVDVFSGIK
jgi:hypothetical protein